MIKYLVIRFSSIGDIVLTSPVIRCLKEQVEDSEIHYLTRPAYLNILKENPHITKVHALEDNMNTTVASLKNENFDYIIDLQNNFRSLNIKRSLKKMYFTVHKQNIKKWLMVNLKINTFSIKHIVERYLDTVRIFDVVNDEKGLDYYIPDEDEIDTGIFPDSFKQGYIVLVTGAKHHTKKLEVNQLINIARDLKYPLVLSGGMEDRDTGKIISDALADRLIFNGCGTWNINQSASVIRQSVCIITHDTGMMHIAAAFKKPIVTVWGNTTPAFGMSAYIPDNLSVNFEVSGLKCRPCSKLGKKACPKDHFRCMRDHNTGTIAETANRLFSGSAQ
ncbi:MAG: glycosyltransferase family 9 protein [Bacteroidales bacterium]|nr:glycosyltransferase family 9 protein [Bacteroidales bacterium]